MSSCEPGSEVAVVPQSSSFDTDWHKLLSEYLYLKAIPDSKPEARRLARQAKGYLIHDDELYHHSTLGIP
jgi:hypothetical protein